ncbi:hypothetical protein QE152_g29424 [Popillia japonica]|uniref:Uncharacterized protein n=1 Tax=Popillia japonica TaxID=7064 RepID=A0AAW1JI37_POPJA
MRPIVLLVALVVHLKSVSSQRLVPPKKYHAEDEDDLPALPDEEQQELDNNGTTGKGLYLGAACDGTCSTKLSHVYCNPNTGTCECEKKYPVKLNPQTGCGKPKKLGEQCYYKETCTYADQYASCIQVHHNAICQCRTGYHTVSIQKPSKREFCAEDLVVMTTNFSTFAGVLSGIALLSGLICFVLKLFNQNMYTGRHRYGNANLPPPIATAHFVLERCRPVADDAGPSIDVQRVEPARGVAVSASRAGSRRPSIASVHSSNSVRSYSMRRYEREREQKEEREMQKRLARMASLTNSTSRIPPTPSPHSTDDLLPTLEEDKQVPLAISEESSNSFQDDLPSTSKQYP